MVVIGTGNVMSHLRLTTNIPCLCFAKYELRSEREGTQRSEGLLYDSLYTSHGPMMACKLVGDSSLLGHYHLNFGVTA